MARLVKFPVRPLKKSFRCFAFCASQSLLHLKSSPALPGQAFALLRFAVPAALDVQPCLPGKALEASASRPIPPSPRDAWVPGPAVRCFASHPAALETPGFTLRRFAVRLRWQVQAAPFIAPPLRFAILRSLGTGSSLPWLDRSMLRISPRFARRARAGPPWPARSPLRGSPLAHPLSGEKVHRTFSFFHFAPGPPVRRSAPHPWTAPQGVETRFLTPCYNDRCLPHSGIPLNP